MEFQVPCQCGHRMIVTEGSAGAVLRCSCGRTVSIPSLKDLRLQVGLAPYDLSPELVLDQLLIDGELPPDRTCIQCGLQTEDVIFVIVECEKAIRKGGFSWSAFILSFLFLPIKILRWEQEVQYGQDKVYTLPLAFCENCRKEVRRPKNIKQCMRQVQIYDRLLEKFPDATIRVL